MSTRAAVFLDRDGTLVEDRGDLSHPGQVSFYPDTIAALTRLGGAFPLFIVTNQSGVARGTLTAEDVGRVNDHIVQELRRAGISVAAVYVCPHASGDGCACRKPAPHFLERAAEEHGVDLGASFVVGDHPSDVALAARAGARGIYVLTGHGAQHRAEVGEGGVIASAIVSGIDEAVDVVVAEHAARVLRAGGLVAFPTETVYGLGADASIEPAVRRIFSVKGRPADHPLIVHLGDPSRLDAWVDGPPSPLARRLAERFWPGPLTLILPKATRVPGVVTGGQGTVGLRVPDHPLALRMLRAHGGGVAAPSANRFGKVSPTTAAHVVEDLGTDVDFVADGGPCHVGIESTIVDLTSGAPIILRPGGVTREALEAVVGAPVAVRGAPSAGGVRAPGLLLSHYAPRARVVLVEAAEVEAAARDELAAGHGKVAILTSAEVAIPDDPALLHLAVAPTHEALARDLYASLREADRAGADVVLVTLPSEDGLGLALRDRLKKAAAAR